MAVRSPILPFITRLLGLTGLALCVLGLGLWQALADMPEVGQYVLIAGGVLAVLSLLFELPGLFRTAGSRRGALGANVIVQVFVAAILLVGGNVFAFFHYQRLDATREQVFTLPADVRGRLAELRDETDIIVYQQYVSFGQRAETRQDKYDLAAQKKIVEKVRDLAELFQDLGPRFRVQVLDLQDDDFQEKLDRIRKASPPLAEAIDKSPENSIFFHSPYDGRVQRLSFNDVYQLDKKASEEADGGRGNLVLNDQGVEKFASKVFNIEERKPRVGIAVVHEYLGMEGIEELGMKGVKKALAQRGFEAKDIILKKWQGGPPEPTVLEHNENKYEFLDAQRVSLERTKKKQEESRADYAKQQTHWRTASLKELNREYALVEVRIDFAFGNSRRTFRPYPLDAIENVRKQSGRLPTTRPVDEEYRADYVREYDEDLADIDRELAYTTKKLDSVTAEQKKLPVDNLAEQRRITDLRAKFNRLLADCDLLIVPRMTLMNVLRGERIPYRVHELDTAQIDAIKDFIKAGKPVLFCLGSANEPGDDPLNPAAANSDSIDKLLNAFDVELPAQTVLYNVEAEAINEAMAEKEGRGLLRSTLPDAPPLRFDDTNNKQPIQQSLGLTARGFGKTMPNDLRLRHPRPVYHLRLRVPPDTAAAAVALADNTPFLSLALMQARATKALDEEAVFLLTERESWNEDKPFPSEEKPLRFERSKGDDLNKGGVQEKRQGPFPIGVAFEAPVPGAWFDKTPARIPEVRIAVIGHGGVFLGETLTPMREKLLLDTSNWLLGRDDLLARASSEPWNYPRAQLASSQVSLWEWGVRLGLPLLFVYVGMVVWMVRRMR